MSNTTIQALVAKFATDLETAFRTQAMAAVREALGSYSSPPAGRLSAPKAAAKPAARVSPRKPGAAKAKPSTRDRRSPQELQAMQHRILEFVKSNPGKRSEDIRAALKLSKKDWQLPAQQLLATKQIVASGVKRSTTYRAR